MSNNTATRNGFSGFFTQDLYGTMENNTATSNTTDGFHLNTFHDGGSMLNNTADNNVQDGFDIGDMGRWGAWPWVSPFGNLGYFDPDANSASGNGATDFNHHED